MSFCFCLRKGMLRDSQPLSGIWNAAAKQPCCIKMPMPACHDRFSACVQMLLRGVNAVGYTSYPDQLVREFVQESVTAGVDIFRVCAGA